MRLHCRGININPVAQGAHLSQDIQPIGGVRPRPLSKP